MIERSLVAVRRDQSRRRPQGFPGGQGPWGAQGPWGQGAYPGHHGDRGPSDHNHGDQNHGDHNHGDRSHGDHAHGESSRGESTRGDHPHGENGHDSTHGWGPRGPWGGFPGPVGDSARPGPGRRGRDGSLGRIARFRMLEALAAAEAEDRQLSVSSLASAIGVDQPRASRLVQEGVERGLVRRVPDPADARRALLQLTAAGRSQLGEVQDHRRSAVEAALASFTPEEARTFAELFDRFVRAWPR
ncbi:MarR family transcriptional regulator [Leifsonia shinshuensis]|nr:MarR family transcriptional regulator [Leifsonia shinshuensis]